MTLQAIHLTPETFEDVSSRLDISVTFRNRTAWIICHDDDIDPLEILPGDIASTPEQALAVHAHIERREAASYRAGERAGRQQTRDQLHELLGINRMAQAILALRDDDVPL